MDSVTIKDIILDKKIDSYNFKKENYVAQGEITITVTLDEYRKLVENNATAQSRIDKAEDDRYKRNSEIEKLKEENDKLKSELYELNKTLDSIKNSCEENNDCQWN